ncbi:MAG: hypothetical protein IT258_20035 [Saprospiraceae bacterium]|nr:hypothetical protein [Saprospiraceae bacterium]
MREAHIFLEIYRSNSILHRQSGKLLPTSVLKVSAAELAQLSSTWLFDWKREIASSEVFKLVLTENPEKVQGLISMEERRGYFHVYLIENAPHNRGMKKEYEGVAGNLFAFACLRSLEKGYGGYISFEAKTELIDHYQKALGAQRIGNSIRMFIDEARATELINLYFSK